MTGTTEHVAVPVAARWLSGLAIACALAAVVLLVAGGLRSLGVFLTAAAGLVLMLTGMWWFVSHLGGVRWFGGALAVLAPVTVLVVFAFAHAIWPLVGIGVLVVTALVSAHAAARRYATARESEAHAPPAAPAPRLQDPRLIMNPRSGGGKVTRFELPARASARGATVTVLTGPEHTDVAEWAREAVAQGADLIGVAGGDGTQALVAAVAAEHGVPFLVLSAGTRNHFAMDLGLDRADPAAGLLALEDGVELCVDLGDINGRTFVNNASFGAYAEVVQQPGYREDKRGTMLKVLPDLLSGHRGSRLVARVDDQLTIEAPTALLVSNNAYELSDLAGLGRRYRLDRGELGVVSVTVDSAARAAQLISGTRSSGLVEVAAREVVVEADAEAIPVGIDGESVLMSTPVTCRIRPAALRVRVPRARPGVGAPPPSAHPAVVVRMALGRS